MERIKGTNLWCLSWWHVSSKTDSYFFRTEQSPMDFFIGRKRCWLWYKIWIFLYDIDTLRVKTWRPRFDTGLVHVYFVENMGQFFYDCFVSLFHIPLMVRVYFQLNNSFVRRTSIRSLVAFIFRLDSRWQTE